MLFCDVRGICAGNDKDGLEGLKKGVWYFFCRGMTAVIPLIYHSIPLQLTSEPGKLKNGLWNCSVPFWPEFRFHFKCNRQKECALGEDERECPYTLCKDGGKFLHFDKHHNIDRNGNDCNNNDYNYIMQKQRKWR